MSGWFDTIWADDLPSRAVTVYMYLRSRADREGKCFPSVRTIRRDTKLSMSTVRRGSRQDLCAKRFAGSAE